MDNVNFSSDDISTLRNSIRVDYEVDIEESLLRQIMILSSLRKSDKLTEKTLAQIIRGAKMIREEASPTTDIYMRRLRVKGVLDVMVLYDREKNILRVDRDYTSDK